MLEYHAFLGNTEGMKIHYSNFDDINSIMTRMLNSKDMKKAITRNNLYKFWKKIVGKKLGDKSKPFSMLPNYTMLVACQSPMVAQELIMQKAQILEKFKPFLKSLHLNVQDLKFDPKKWNTDNFQSDEVIQQPIKIELPTPTQKELDAINLDVNELELIKKAVDSNEFASLELRQKMFQAIEIDLKIQKFRQT